jgi:hypothetical protein
MTTFIISLLSGAGAKFVAVTDRNIKLIFRFTHDSYACCMYVCRMYQQVFFRSVAAKIGSPLESNLSLYFLQIQKGPTVLFKGFPGNT